jgi:hypothetical protein
MAIFDNIGGLLGNLGDYGFGVPSNTGGLISDAERDAINKRALVSGGLNALLTYAGTPKNLNAGSPIPYLARAGLAGFGASQNVVDQALNTALRNKIASGRDDNIRTIKQDRFEITQERQPDGTYKEIARSPLDASKDNKQRQYTGNFENVAINMFPNIDPMDLDENQRKQVYDRVKELAAAGVIANLPLREEEANYRFRSTTPKINTPKFATMQDVSDTAKATGKTTNQVIQDLKSKGIQVRTQ